MRNVYKLTLCSVVALLSVSLVVGQPGGKGKGGRFGGFQGGGFPGGGFRPGGDPLSMIRSKSIQEELKITEAQLEKLPGAIRNALKEVLEPSQLQRLEQIQLQMKGVNAFRDTEVQAKLGLSRRQKDEIADLFEATEKERKALFEAVKGQKGGFRQLREKMANLQKELASAVHEVLTSSQKSTWEEMTGPEYERPSFGFGGKGGKGGFKGKKKRGGN